MPSDKLREQVEAHLRDGVVSVSIAFNLSKCREWRFDQATQERAGELIRELVHLFHDRKIYVDEALSAARSDEVLQRLLQKAILKVECFPESIERKARKKAVRK